MISGSDNVDEWSDDGGEWMWMQLTTGLDEKANAVTTQVNESEDKDEYSGDEEGELFAVQWSTSV